MKIRHILAFCMILAMAGFASCSDNHDHEGHNHELEEGHDHEHEGHDHEHEGHDHEAASEGAHSDEIIFPAAKAKAAGVETMTVNASTFSEVIPTSGRILPNSGDVATISSTRAGIVKFVRPWGVGMPVSAGTALFTVSSAGLPDGDPAAKVRVDYSKAKADYERAEKMYEKQLITQSEYLDAKAAYENAKISAASMKGDAGGSVTITARNAGFVTDCLVKNGEYVEVGTPLMTISSNRRLRLQADLPQREYSRIGSIRSANFRISQSDNTLSLKDMNGRLVSYGKSSENTGAFIPLLFEFDNAAGIPSGVMAEVYLIGAPREGVISVPKTALTEEQGIYYVYVRLDEDGYAKRNVTIGKSDGVNVEIVSGLNNGEEVVSKGAMHVKLASASKAIPGHTHNH